VGGWLAFSFRWFALHEWHVCCSFPIFVWVCCAKYCLTGWWLEVVHIKRQNANRQKAATQLTAPYIDQLRPTLSFTVLLVRLQLLKKGKQIVKCSHFHAEYDNCRPFSLALCILIHNIHTAGPDHKGGVGWNSIMSLVKWLGCRFTIRVCMSYPTWLAVVTVLSYTWIKYTSECDLIWLCCISYDNNQGKTRWWMSSSVKITSMSDHVGEFSENWLAVATLREHSPIGRRDTATAWGSCKLSAIRCFE
jgi:hypothetical protein